MNQNLSTLTKVGNWIATLLLGNTRELIIRIDERVNTLTADMKEVKATLKEHGEDITVLKTDVSMLKTDVYVLKTDMSAMKMDVATLKMDMSALKTYVGYNIRHSPNVPSEKGKKLLEESGFNELYPRLRQKVFLFIEKKNPQTLYDYEKEAENALRSLIDDPLIYRLKDYVIEHEDQPLVLIFEIASWIVRDDYLKEHPLPSRQH
jgi:uncharacterized protein (UPF0335 family)